MPSAPATVRNWGLVCSIFPTRPIQIIRGPTARAKRFEFDYFPADDYGDPASVDATLVDAEANFSFPYDDLTLNSNVTYRILLLHQANAAAISGEIFTNGQLMTSLPDFYSDMPTNDSGAFQLDTLSVSSYTDNGFGDILAHGTVSKIAVAVAAARSGDSKSRAGQVQFASDTNWLYTLEQSSDLQNWSPAATAFSATEPISFCKPPIFRRTKYFIASARICHEPPRVHAD